ncbi:MAG TPA: peptidoglycan-binding protein [Gaiellaceae bacterium]|nr:peptidoglycan-binding protein [Gaiellaceae bacterium]
MTRHRTFVVLGVAGGVVALVVVLFASGVFSSNAPAAASSDNAYPTARAKVERTTLTAQTQVDATLGYGDSSTIAAAAGTAPSAVTQARQAATTATGQLATAKAAAAADTATLLQAKTAVAADKAKAQVDCAGDAAAAVATAPSSHAQAGGDSGGGDASPCTTDAQTLSTDEQAESQAAGKVAADAQSVAAASAAVASAGSAVTAAVANETFYGQASTFTALPTLGTVVGRGDELYAIDGQPVVLMLGSVAAWRAFVPGVAPGRDVAQLNANLRALGYPAAAGDAFTSTTKSAIEALQAKLGEPATGELLLGSVVFEPHPVRVTAVTPAAGSVVQAGPVLSVTSTRRVVTVQLDASEQNQVKLGDAVVITLPDNSTTPGRVTYVGTVATTPSDSGDNAPGGGSSTPTIEVDVTPTHPGATGRLDQAPVLVSITNATARNVLAVPVDALLALSSGGYAVEEVRPGGARQLVGVDLGLFDDASGEVQVSGAGLAAGQTVVVPAE